jgi:hypothetical protein
MASGNFYVGGGAVPNAMYGLFMRFLGYVLASAMV